MTTPGCPFPKREPERSANLTEDTKNPSGFLPRGVIDPVQLTA